MKKLPKYVWGNGVGSAPELWFSRPKKFVLSTTKGNMGSEFQEYVPVGDKKSNFFDGGCWLEPKFGTYSSADCIVCVSENREDVMEFTRIAKDIVRFKSFWQNGFLECWKKHKREKS